MQKKIQLINNNLRYFSDEDAYKEASEPKEVYIVPNANHEVNINFIYEVQGLQLIV